MNIFIDGTKIEAVSNKYTLTDTDATFMRMKEDAMMNGQLKPAYNIQHGEVKSKNLKKTAVLAIILLMR